MRWRPTSLPWRPAAAATLFIAAMAALGGGFGVAFLSPAPGPIDAVKGFALMGLAGVLFAAVAAALGLTGRDEGRIEHVDLPSAGVAGLSRKPGGHGGRQGGA